LVPVLLHSHSTHSPLTKFCSDVGRQKLHVGIQFPTYVRVLGPDRTRTNNKHASCLDGGQYINHGKQYQQNNTLQALELSRAYAINYWKRMSSISNSKRIRLDRAVPTISSVGSPIEEEESAIRKLKQWDFGSNDVIVEKCTSKL